MFDQHDEYLDPETAAALAYEMELEAWLEENAPEHDTFFVGFPDDEPVMLEWTDADRRADVMGWR
jgi:hypothetical protein